MNRLQPVFLVITLAFVLLAACGTPSAPTSEVEPEIYDLHGEVVGIMPEEHVVIVKHDEIVGWMKAMTMEFPVADPADIERVSVGDIINAKVRVEDLDYRLADIQVVTPAESVEREASEPQTAEP